MRTTKAISTISFNTPAFLELKLEELTKAKRISFWAYILHQPEDDEGGRKQHMHVFAVPSKMIQTDDLKEELKEFDPEHPDKPRGCISWNISKFDPWYMYILHDRKYLASKGQSRKYQYYPDEVITSDPDELLVRVRSIDLLALSPYMDMENALNEGLSWDQFFARGTIPITLVNQYEKAWHLLTLSKAYRGKHANHPMDTEEEELPYEDE